MNLRADSKNLAFKIVVFALFIHFQIKKADKKREFDQLGEHKVYRGTLQKRNSELVEMLLRPHRARARLLPSREGLEDTRQDTFGRLSYELLGEGRKVLQSNSHCASW